MCDIHAKRFAGWMCLALWVMACGCVNVPGTRSYRGRALAADVDRILQSDSSRDAQVALLVREMDTGSVMVARQAETQMVPASNVKLVTAAGALLVWPPDRRFQTTMTLAGEISQGIFTGDVVVASEGDPSLRPEFTDNPLAYFEQWAAELNARGVRAVRGNIVLVENAQGLAGYGAGWALDDLPWGYATPVSRHQIYGNQITVTIDPPAGGSDDYSIQVSPPQAGKWLDRRVTDAGAEPVTVTWRPGKPGLQIRGKGPANDAEIFHVAMPEPAEVYGEALKDTFGCRGITVTGDVMCQPSYSFRSKFLVLTPCLSPPVSVLLKVMMKQSDNLLAETLVRLAGAGETGGFSSAAGRALIQEKLTGAGVDLTHARYADGSGLSRYNHFSASQLVSVLRVMGRGRRGELWRRLLPVAGVDGTLSQRFADTPLAGNLRGKTGSMSSIRALSGYFTGQSGGEYVFSILVNGASAPGRDVNTAVDKVLVLLYQNL